MLLVSFWFSFIVDCVCKHVHTSLVHLSLPSFLLFTLENRPYPRLSPVTTDDASCFDASWLGINTNAPLFSCSTHSAKLSFFQKSAAVIMIVYFTCIIECKEWRERVHVQDKIEYSNMLTFLCQKQEIQVCIVFCTEVQYYLIFTGV